MNCISLIKKFKSQRLLAPRSCSYSQGPFGPENHQPPHHNPPSSSSLLHGIAISTSQSAISSPRTAPTRILESALLRQGRKPELYDRSRSSKGVFAPIFCLAAHVLERNEKYNSCTYVHFCRTHPWSPLSSLSRFRMSCEPSMDSSR